MSSRRLGWRRQGGEADPLHKVPLERILLRLKYRGPELYQRRPLMHDLVPENEASPTTRVTVVLAWLPVTLPLLWGIWQTVKKAAVLFR